MHRPRTHRGSVIDDNSRGYIDMSVLAVRQRYQLHGSPFCCRLPLSELSLPVVGGLLPFAHSAFGAHSVFGGRSACSITAVTCRSGHLDLDSLCRAVLSCTAHSLCGCSSALAHCVK